MRVRHEGCITVTLHFTNKFGVIIKKYLKRFGIATIHITLNDNALITMLKYIFLIAVALRVIEMRN